MNQITTGANHAQNEQINFSSFDSQFVATVSPGGMNNNGWRRFRRKATIPQAVFTTLRQSGIIKEESWIFDCQPTVGELLEFLKCYPYESLQARQTGEYIFRQIFNTDIPSLNRIFAQEGNA